MKIHWTVACLAALAAINATGGAMADEASSEGSDAAQQGTTAKATEAFGVAPGFAGAGCLGAVAPVVAASPCAAAVPVVTQAFAAPAPCAPPVVIQPSC